MNKAVKAYLEKHGFEAFCPKAVLFDMDGVLYDSMPNHAVAWRESMAKFGITMTTEQAYATEGQRGVDTIRQMAMQQLGHELTEEEAQTMYDEKTRIFHLMPEAPMMPGAWELMKKMHSSGLCIGVVTGSGQRPLIARLLRDYGEFLDEQHIVTAYDIKKGKPHPDPYLKGLEKAGCLNPWEAIVVENAPLGVEASIAANIFTICVNSGHLPDDVFLAKGTDLVFNDMQALNHDWENLFGTRSKNQDERWNEHYEEVMHFVKMNKRRPSKYSISERQLHNWIKYNKKRMARQLLPADRTDKFLLLLQKIKGVRRINQYT